MQINHEPGDLLQQLIVVQSVKKYAPFYGSHRLNGLFTIHFNIILIITVVSEAVILHLRFLPKLLTHLSPSYACCMTPSAYSLLEQQNNICKIYYAMFYIILSFRSKYSTIFLSNSLSLQAATLKCNKEWTLTPRIAVTNQNSWHNAVQHISPTFQASTSIHLDDTSESTFQALIP